MSLEDFKNVGEVFGFDGSYNKPSVNTDDYEEILLDGDLNVGDTFTGSPSCIRFDPKYDENTGEYKSYTNILMTLINEEEGKLLKYYSTVPDDYPILEQPIRRSNNFLYSGFNFIISTMKVLAPESVKASNGEEKNVVNAGLNIEKIVEMYNLVDEVTVEVTQYHDTYFDSDEKILKVIDIK